jgi:tetraacyldisaccharide 4'-kinase
LRLIERVWQTRNVAAWALTPLSLVFSTIRGLRRLGYATGIARRHRFPVPVVVVGNITVGGTGKTPLVIWLARHLQRQGWRPGLVARGYGGRAARWPQQVRSDSDVHTVGDEAVLLATATGCPMCVGPDRPAAVAALLAHTDVDIVISDDGLQHYALARDLEIAVVDGERRFGNGLPLPAGPLREPLSRLKRVDLVVVNGEAADGAFAMTFVRPRLRHLHRALARPLDSLAGSRVHAVAGIGNPARFFDLLRAHGMDPVEHALPDHHRFSAGDLRFDDDLPILMTAKDAVKCTRFPCDDCWVVEVDAEPDAGFVARLDELLTKR